MNIDIPTHKRYYENEIDYHFKLETEILWAWSVNFNHFIENLHKQYENKLRDLMNTFELEKINVHSNKQ